MERKNPRKSPVGGGGGGATPAKVSRKRNKNGISKIKEEKPPVGVDGGGPGGGPSNPGGPDMGDGSGIPTPSNKGLHDDIMMNGSDIKLENPSTPQLLDAKNECPPDIPPLPELGHPDFPDCKPPMNYNCYPHYNNNMPPNSMNMSPHPSGPGPGPQGPSDYGPPHPQGQQGMMGGNYGPPPPPPQQQQQQPPSTKQQPSTMDAQYMQQQSQIFVFSTKLANKAAEAVFQQQYPSIIAYHMSQPATRKFLEKNPFKVNNFGRQFPGNPNWPPPQAPPGGGGGGKMKGNKGQMMQMPPGGPPPQNMPPDFNPMHQGPNSGPGGPGCPPGGPGCPPGGPGCPPGGPGCPPGGPGCPPGGPGCPPGGPGWNTHNSPKPPQPGYPNYYDGSPYCGQSPQGPGGPGGSMGPCPGGPGGPGGPPNGPPGGPMGPGGPGGPGGQPPGYFGGPNAPPCQPPGPMPSGVKIPDENLTPQQRMHREEKLRTLGKIQNLLFPENDHPGGMPGGDPNCPPMPPPDNMDPYNMHPNDGPPGGPGMGMDSWPGGPGNGPPNNKPPGNDWPSNNSGFFMDGQQPPQGLKPPNGPPGMGPQGNGPRNNKTGGGSIPSPATPLTPGSSCGAPHRPSPHSPLPNDPLYPGGGGHSYYPSGYYSPQVGQVQDNSPNTAVQRKDSESSNSEGGKSRKEKSSCSISPTSSAPPSVKEANLMPVPSPQQIQYLNVFEGQELTIQKQPNVGLADHNSDASPVMPSSSMDMNPSTPNHGQQQKPSHSAPPTPVSMPSGNQKSTPEVSLTSNSGSSKTRPGSVGPVVTPKNSTTPNPSPQGVDRTSQPGTPLQMNLDGLKSSSSGNFGPGPMGPGSNSGPPSCNMMKQGMPPMGMDGPHPDGPGNGVFDNVPLNPNLSGPGPPGNKPAFDPISSMVQMSQQLGGNGAPPNSSAGGMNANGGYGMNQPGGPPMNPNMVNFNTSMHSVQNVDGGMAMGGPQTVNNTYVNATMTIQQMNIQNIPPYMSPGPGMGPMGPHQMGNHMGQQMGGPMGHMPPSISGPGNMGGGPPPMGGGPPPNMGPGPQQMGPGGPMGPMGPMGQQMPPGMGPMGPCGGPPGMPGGPRGGPPPQMGYGNQPPPPRMGQGGQGGGSNRSSPYARMPNNPNGPPRAFGGTNIQVKPNAPNTIQYLPARPPPPHNQGPPGMCSQSGVMGGPGPGPGPGPGVPGPNRPNLDFLQRYTNPNSGPVVNVNMGMNVNVNMSGNRMPYSGLPSGSGPGGPGPMGPGPNNGPSPGCGPMRGPHPMMDQVPPSGPGMKGPPGGYPGGPPPSGPPQLPPSDPAYAQQFHHFQQQLYATGSNNGRNPMQPNVQNNPNTPPNQSFFNF